MKSRFQHNRKNTTRHGFDTVAIALPGGCFWFLDVLCGFDIKRRPFHSYRSIGRHPHADRQGLQPARVDALFGGKGLPPY